jgi:hypothetical protein
MLEWVLVLWVGKTKLDISPFNSYEDCRRMGDLYLKYDNKLRNNCVGVTKLKEKK